MFLLDTNVLSALLYPTPPIGIVRWIEDRRYDELVTASVCQAELLAGLDVMPQGRRRQHLERAATAMFAEDFAGQILSFDSAAALSYAQIFGNRRRLGRPIAMADLMIAAIALSRGASVVTRNTSDFEGCGVAVVNPWNEE